MDDLSTNLQEETAVFPEWYEAVYSVVRTVPAGKVITYGQAADLVQNIVITARQAGAAMRYAPKDVPWQRVVGAGGYLPVAKRSPELQLLQRKLLANEGVYFSPGDSVRVDMNRSQWLDGQSVGAESAAGSLFDDP